MTRLTCHANSSLPTKHGPLRLFVFGEAHENQANTAPTHAAMATATLGEGALVRLHSECLTGDVFASLRCDCGPQLALAQEMIAATGNGLLIYLRGHEGRGIGLAEKIRAYALQEQGHDTVTANWQLGHQTDLRDYDAAVQILQHFGLSRVRLLTNNPSKLHALTKAGIEVEARVPLWTTLNPHNAGYVATKKQKMRHLA